MLSETGAHRLRRAREARGLSLRMTARLIEVSASTVLRAETPGTEVWFTAVHRLAELYDISLDSLTAPSSCERCDGAPPRGFTCNGCGSSGG